MTAIYSALHFLVDGVCALAMFGWLRGNPAGFLLYNFWAFAMQFPLGAILDRVEHPRMPRYFALAGCVLTLLGTAVGPAVLGLGNALFHVGGGVEIIGEDSAKDKGGALLGIFVAPGALGLYVGRLLAGNPWGLVPGMLGMALLLWRLMPKATAGKAEPSPGKGNGWAVAGICFAVVVLRSYVGMAVSFPWKAGALGFLATLAVVGGKMLGGLLGAKFGGKAVAACSLLLAALGFALGDWPVFGLLALLCFNMTMPLTLYALWRRFPEYPGATFGALTLGLFLGFLPVYYGIDLPLGGIGASLWSLLLLWNIL